METSAVCTLLESSSGPIYSSHWLVLHGAGCLDGPTAPATPAAALPGTADEGAEAANAGGKAVKQPQAQINK